MNHQPYNAFIKNPAREVVDIGEANPRLSKFLKLSHFLMPKHVPNVALPCESALYKFIHPPTTSLTTHLSKIRLTSCRYRRGESDAIKNFEIIPLFDAKTCT